MKQRPILFSTPMVKAITEGRKTQTRRIIKGIDETTMCDLYELYDKSPDYFSEICPYGKPGDILWVREKWRQLVNCSTGEQVQPDYYAEMPEDFHKMYPHKWKPSIHMKKEHARIWLRIRSVRVERLKDISRDDARAEGIEIDIISGTRFKHYVDGSTTYNERTSFYTLWEKINGKESLYSNPWLWVLEFERIEKPEKQ
jgi:hypothetical protein